MNALGRMTSKLFSRCLIQKNGAGFMLGESRPTLQRAADGLGQDLGHQAQPGFGRQTILG